MTTIELTFKNISEIAGIDDIGLLMLTDKANERQIAIPCDRDQLRAFKLRLNKDANTKTLLPEVMWQATRWFLGRPMEVDIARVNGGQYD